MKSGKLARFLCLGILAAFAAGCAVADTGAFVRIQQDVEALKKEVAAARGSQAAAPASPGRAETGEISSLQKNVADLTANYDQVKSDQVATATRADEMKVQLQKADARLSEQEQALQEMKGKVARAEGIERRVAALEEKVEKLSASSGGPSAAAAPAPQNWKNPEEMYDYAVGLVKGGDPRRGRQVLGEFASKHPGHRLVPNVFYWRGESFYAEKDYENAILSFQDVIDKYPGGDKAPDAMYKQGLSFLALKDRKNARIVFELVQSKYPKTSAAAQAKQKLAELK